MSKNGQHCPTFLSLTLMDTASLLTGRVTEKLVQPRLFWGFYYVISSSFEYLSPSPTLTLPTATASVLRISIVLRMSYPEISWPPHFQCGNYWYNPLASGVNLFVVNQDHINVKHRGYVVTRGLVSDVADLQHPLVSSPVLSITNT